MRAFIPATVFIELLLSIFSHGQAQTGPGGVGSSSTNALWLSGDFGVYSDAGTTLASNTDNVRQWNDRSGNSDHAGQATTAARPAYRTNIINGRPVIRFSTSSTADQLVATNIADGDEASVFTVVSYTSLPSSNPGILQASPSGQASSSTANQKTIGQWVASSGNVWGRGVENNNTIRDISQVTNLSASTFYQIATIYDYDGTDIDQFVNGATSGVATMALPLKDWVDVSIGMQAGSEGWNGDIAEVIMFNVAINDAQRYIVQNYLAAKYGLSLSANDYYDEDDVANGNYDYEVAGIGRSSSATNTNTDAQGSGVVRILNPTGLNNNEYYIWGHDGGAFSFSEPNDVPAFSLINRLSRVWRGSETGSITDFDVRVDLSSIGGTFSPSQLMLLIDTDNDGTFSDETKAGGGVVFGATSIGGSVFQFSDVTGMNNNLRFTFAYVTSGAGCSVYSSDGYAVDISVNPRALIPSSMTCPFGYNYNLVVDYVVTFSGTNIPANLYTLQGTITCGSESHFFNMNNAGGASSSTSGSNPYTSDTDCATATPISRNCASASIQVEGPGITNQFISCSGGILLPVEFVSFDASNMRSGSVLLEWITATELNNDYFEVQRSFDGAEWVVLGLVEGNGTTSHEHQYEFEDTSPLFGANYYRIRQVDFDGMEDYTNVKKVDVENENRVVIFPNPAQTEVVISSQSIIDEAFVYDLRGVVVSSANGNNSNQIRVDVSRLPIGTYVLETRTNGSSVHTQVIISR